MLSRRRFIGTGLAALAAGLASRSAAGALSSAAGGLRAAPRGIGPAPLAALDPLPPSTMIDGLPFAGDGWAGDVWNYDTMPFHHIETNYPGGEPPAPTEQVEIAIVGGGLSGLTTAYLLRKHNPVVFEVADRFGGVARGETWNGIPYSLGSAYFMNPDEGSDLERFYTELGFDRSHRLSSGTDPVELNGAIIENIFEDPAVPQAERDAMARYRELVLEYAENYPDIPLLGDSTEHQWVLDLDKLSFRQHVESRIGVVPPLLASLIQGYFYSSFNAGWEEISAAAGWNFVAAEEYGRWLLPGGNAGFVQALYERLAAEPHNPGRDSGTGGGVRHNNRLRHGQRVVELRPQPDGRLLVISSDGQGHFKSLLARRVVMACPKHVARRILSSVLPEDNAWIQATRQVYTNPYLVVNLLLNRPLGRDFYDLFMLWDGAYPTDASLVEPWHRITDVVNGVFNQVNHDQRSVLTCYWPLPYASARFPLFPPDSFATYAHSAAPRIRHILTTLGLPASALVQARMARWGHAFPLARTGFYIGGGWKELRQPPIPGVFCVCQDNWVLPAVEVCLQEAMEMAPKIADGL